MKDDRAFILREDKAEEFLSKPKKNPRIMIKEMSESIAELEEENKQLKNKLNGKDDATFLAGVLFGSFITVLSGLFIGACFIGSVIK